MQFLNYKLFVFIIKCNAVLYHFLPELDTAKTVRGIQIQLLNSCWIQAGNWKSDFEPCPAVLAKRFRIRQATCLTGIQIKATLIDTL